VNIFMVIGRPRFEGSPVNPAFNSDLSELLPKAHIWVHGHVHDPFDYRVEAIALKAAVSWQIRWVIDRRHQRSRARQWEVAPVLELLLPEHRLLRPGGNTVAGSGRIDASGVVAAVTVKPVRPPGRGHACRHRVVNGAE
jgi:hypothetical protein